MHNLKIKILFYPIGNILLIINGKKYIYDYYQQLFYHG